MMHHVYAIYDVLVGEFQNIFVCTNDKSAIRVFTQSINSSNHPLRQLYKDIDLYRLCGLDLNTGTIYNLDDSVNGKEFLIHGTDVFADIPYDLEAKVTDAIIDKAKLIVDKELKKQFDCAKLKVDEVVDNG